MGGIERINHNNYKSSNFTASPGVFGLPVVLQGHLSLSTPLNRTFQVTSSSSSLSSSSSSKEATRFSAALAKCSMLGSSSFLILVSSCGAAGGIAT